MAAFLIPLSIEDVVITDKSSVQSNNKISILDVVDKGQYYAIYYQITAMSDLANSIYNNDQMIVIASRRDIHTRPPNHGRMARTGNKKVRYTEPHIWSILDRSFKNDYEHSRITSRIGSVNINKSSILEEFGMSRSCLGRFINNNYDYLYVKVRLELAKWYHDGYQCAIGVKVGGSDILISPRLSTECNTIIFKCTYKH